MGRPASSTTAVICIQAHDHTAIFTAPYCAKVWEQFIEDVVELLRIYGILKRTHLENFSHHINNLHQNIQFTTEEEINGNQHFLTLY